MSDKSTIFKSMTVAAATIGMDFLERSSSNPTRTTSRTFHETFTKINYNSFNTCVSIDIFHNILFYFGLQDNGKTQILFGATEVNGPGCD